jgi:hypothetical protein
VVVVGHGRVRERPRIRVGTTYDGVFVGPQNWNEPHTHGDSSIWNNIDKSLRYPHRFGESPNTTIYGSILVGSPPPPSLVRWCSALQC